MLTQSQGPKSWDSAAGDMAVLETAVLLRLLHMSTLFLLFLTMLSAISLLVHFSGLYCKQYYPRSGFIVFTNIISSS